MEQLIFVCGQQIFTRRTVNFHLRITDFFTRETVDFHLRITDFFTRGTVDFHLQTTSFLLTDKTFSLADDRFFYSWDSRFSLAGDKFSPVGQLFVVSDDSLQPSLIGSNIVLVNSKSACHQHGFVASGADGSN